MGPRGVMGQMPPGHLGNQSGLNSLSKTSRAISIPSSLSRLEGIIIIILQ